MTDTNEITLGDFPGIMYERLIPLSDLHLLRNPGLASNQKKAGQAKADFHHYLNYWRRNGLLPFIEKGKQGKLSFVQLIWIQILESMRELGLSLDFMKNACHYFFADAWRDNIPKINLTNTKKLLQEKMKLKAITDDEKNTLQYVNKILAIEGWLTSLKFDLNYLTNLVTACSQEGWRGGVIIFADGEIAEFVNSKYYSHNNLHVDPDRPHVYLPLKYYLSFFFDDNELSSMIAPVIFNEDEQLILKEIRKKNIKEIKIKLEDGKVERFDSTEHGTISGDKAKEIKRILGLKNYESITVDTLNDKTVSFKKTKKKVK